MPCQRSIVVRTSVSTRSSLIVGLSTTPLAEHTPRTLQSHILQNRGLRTPEGTVYEMAIKRQFVLYGYKNKRVRKTRSLHFPMSFILP